MISIAKLLDKVAYGIFNTLYSLAVLNLVLLNTLFIPFTVGFVFFFIFKQVGGLAASISLIFFLIVIVYAAFKENGVFRSMDYLKAINDHLLDRENIEKHRVLSETKRIKEMTKESED